MTCAARCPYCLAPLADAGEVVVRCVACGTEHHRACFVEHGRCTVLGCSAARFRCDPGAARVLGSLHPFLAVGREPRLRRSAGFLAVRPPQVERVRRAAVSLRLDLPRLAVAGAPLEGLLRVEAPRALRGQGLRLRVDTLLADGGRLVCLRSEEAALAGGAARSWLERVALWARPRRGLLLARGRTTFRFSLDPAPLRWRGRLGAREALGPSQVLRLTAVLDAEVSEESEPAVVRLTDGRPAPSSLGADAHALLAEPLAPPVLSAAGLTPSAPRSPHAPAPASRAWTACPVRVSTPGGPPDAVAAVRRTGGRASVPRVDEIDLELAPLAPGPAVLRGRVALRLAPRAWPGARRVVVHLTLERRRTRTHRWVAFAREDVELATEPERHGAVGRHRLELEVPLGPAFRGPHQRRVRVQAVLYGGGLPLRADERDVVVAPPRRGARGGRRT